MSGVPDYPVDQTLDFKFTSRAFATGIPTTLAGTPAVVVYINNSLVQITAGITLTVDFDGITGSNNLRIVATVANGYLDQSSFQAEISAGTVGGVSVVGEVVQQFSINRSPALRSTVAGRALDVTAAGNAGIDWANIENKTATVVFTATTVNLVNTVTANSDMRGTDGANTVTPPTAAVISDTVHDELRSEHVIAGSFGEGVASVQGNVTGSVASVSGAVASVTAAVTVGTNNDKTGYLLSAAGNLAVIQSGNIDGFTVEQALRLIGASAAGVAAGGGTSSMTYKGLNVATVRITATGLDENGNRPTVVLNAA